MIDYLTISIPIEAPSSFLQRVNSPLKLFGLNFELGVVIKDNNIP